MTREQAIIEFCKEYVAINALHIPYIKVRSIVEMKLVETNNAFYLRDSHLKLPKG